MSTRLKSFQKTCRGKLILVDDDELLAKKIQEDFRKLNMECQVFLEMKSAAEYIRNNDVHGVITDIFLDRTKPTGLEIVSVCKDMGVPVIIITSAIDLHIAKEGLNRGADYLMEKPLNVSELADIFEELWDNPRGLIGRRERFLDQFQLTAKEKECARLILKGLSNKEIAMVLETTVSTIKFYSNQIFEKCDVGSRGEFFNSVFPT